MSIQKKIRGDKAYLYDVTWDPKTKRQVWKYLGPDIGTTIGTTQAPKKDTMSKYHELGEDWWGEFLRGKGLLQEFRDFLNTKPFGSRPSSIGTTIGIETKMDIGTSIGILTEEESEAIRKMVDWILARKIRESGRGHQKAASFLKERLGL